MDHISMAIHRRFSFGPRAGMDHISMAIHRRFSFGPEAGMDHISAAIHRRFSFGPRAGMDHISILTRILHECHPEGTVMPSEAKDLPCFPAGRALTALSITEGQPD